MNEKRKILCSACLIGVKCRYDGQIKPNEKVLAMASEADLIPICPEQLGGQATPRPPAEIIGGDGKDVLNGKIKVKEPDGTDVTNCFISGAYETLKIAQILGVNEAILKQRSPSCGSGQIYDGTFTKKVVKGDGATTALLKQNGLKVISEEDI